MNVAESVREFHDVFGLPAADVPGIPSNSDLRDLRARLLREEVDEVIEAAEADDLVGVAQELADVIYVTYGYAITYGIDLDAVVAEVHRANMSKLDDDGRPIIRPDGKILKSANYTPPDVAAVLHGGAR